MDNLMIMETSFWIQKIFQKYRNPTTNFTFTDCNLKVLNYNLVREKTLRNGNMNFILKLTKPQKTLQ